MSDVPVPKPRARYRRDGIISVHGDLQYGSNSTDPLPAIRSSDSRPCPVSFPESSAPGLSSLADNITIHIPSLAGGVSTVAKPATAPYWPPAANATSLDHIANLLVGQGPILDGAASMVANSVYAAIPPSISTAPCCQPVANAVNLDHIISSLAGQIPSLAGMISCVASPAVGPTAPPVAASGLPTLPAPVHAGNGYRLYDPMAQAGVTIVTPTRDQTMDASGGKHPSDRYKDIEALSLRIMGMIEGATDPPDQVSSPTRCATVLPHWPSQEELESDSSNEEPETSAAFSHTSKPVSNQSVEHPLPASRAASQSKHSKQKIPRTATIRVSRKKPRVACSIPVSTITSSWLDVWRGLRHNVFWATLDGGLMSLWKKRNDRFSEVVFHVSSITRLKDKQDKRHFSIYFNKKRIDFMAYSEVIQEEWVSSLLAGRGSASPAPSQLYGPITIKDPRSRAFAAVWCHDLWIYHNKEHYQLGVAWFSVPLSLASVKQSAKHSFSLITPSRTFSLSVDSSKDLGMWLSGLSTSVRSALSCSQVALQLRQSPWNLHCGDCGSAHPDWASVNLLLLMCDACAGQHRALGSTLSKVRSVSIDDKIWTEQLIQLFVCHGNWLANQVWSPVVPASEQVVGSSSDEERSKFIQDKYVRGRYRRQHPLVTSHKLLNQRLCEVVCTDNVEETMSLICSGALVSCQSADGAGPSPISLAEQAGQPLQVELLRQNEHTDIPQSANNRTDSAPSVEEDLHGKLEEDRFLFSLENDAAACDVLDLREVHTVFVHSSCKFELLSLSDRLLCDVDTPTDLQTHLNHILQVIIPVGVSQAEVGGALAVSKVCVLGEGGALLHSGALALLHVGGVTVIPAPPSQQHFLKLLLNKHTHIETDSSENIIKLKTGDRIVCLRFEEDQSCQEWSSLLLKILANQTSSGSVPLAITRCIDHITQYGLRVEGLYRRCGLVSKVSRLVEQLITSPDSVQLERGEQGVLDAGSALKQYVRQQPPLIPSEQRAFWVKAAGLDERSRLSACRRLLQQLASDSRATLGALCGHFYMVQLYSSENKMTAHNLAVVLVPTLFQELAVRPELLPLTRDLIVHHHLLLLPPEEMKTNHEFTPL